MSVAGVLETTRFTITLAWDGPVSSYAVSPFQIQGMDFAFVLAFLVGIYAMHRLSMVAEGEPVGRSVVVRTLFAEVRRPTVPLTSVDGAVTSSCFLSRLSGKPATGSGNA